MVSKCTQDPSPKFSDRTTDICTSLVLLYYATFKKAIRKTLRTIQDY